jgi:hypothetical protein
VCLTADNPHLINFSKAENKPVVFIYGRALHQLALDDWEKVLVQGRHDNPGGGVFVPDSWDASAVTAFDGSSHHNIVPEVHGEISRQFQPWLHVVYPKACGKCWLKLISRHRDTWVRQ